MLRRKYERNELQDIRDFMKAIETANDQLKLALNIIKSASGFEMSPDMVFTLDDNMVSIRRILDILDRECNI